MPELPDVTLYVEAFERRHVGRRLERVRILSPSLLRTFDPPVTAAEGRRMTGARRIGKRIVWALEGDLFLVFHLMVAGRFHCKKPASKHSPRTTHAVFVFEGDEVLALTEASTKKRASLHVVAGEPGLRAFDAGGVEPLDATLETFRAALLRENHTLKRALTDPRIVSGIGNAYSDEILHRARLSPVQHTARLSGDELVALHRATQAVLREWTDRLRDETGEAFPKVVTAFREGFAVHGRYEKPCPVCRTAVQRIRYAENETNYCPTCQTKGKLLADRSLSRLLKDDWPKTVDELEERLR
ncbi:MAG: Fpg/Nei family DNA glycosylase [Methanobacteriota archaeon]